MVTTVQRTAIGVGVLVAATAGSLVTMAVGGSATPSGSPTISHVSVAVHLTNGKTEVFSNVKKLQLYAGAEKLKITLQTGQKTTIHKGDLASYTTSYVQNSSTSPTTSPTPTSSTSTTPTTSATPTTSSSVTPTSSSSSCIGSLCLP